MKDKNIYSLDEFGRKCAEIIENLCDMRSTCVAIYIMAKGEHTRWVHLAVYSKKKRVRKKYLDRIARTYGGKGINGKSRQGNDQNCG